jgi:hypothetical protein
VVSYFLRYFSSNSTEQISPDSAGPFTSFDPVSFAIFATHAQSGLNARAAVPLAISVSSLVFSRSFRSSAHRFRRAS